MRHTVLIADPDVDTSTIAAGLLRSRGLRVRTAVDGVEARDIVSGERHLVVVVLGLDLPGMNGFELLRLLRGRFGAPRLGNDTRIVAVSRRRELAAEQFALRLGADVFLRQPIPLVQFIRVIEKLVSRATPRAA